MPRTNLTKGDCYKVAFTIATEDLGAGLRLCHGTVTGTAEPVLGERFGHAWVEDAAGEIVTDKANGNDVTIDRRIYYAVGQIVDDEVTRYSAEEACVEALRTGNYGPWEGD